MQSKVKEQHEKAEWWLDVSWQERAQGWSYIVGGETKSKQNFFEWSFPQVPAWRRLLIVTDCKWDSDHITLVRFPLMFVLYHDQNKFLPGEINSPVMEKQILLGRYFLLCSAMKEKSFWRVGNLLRNWQQPVPYHNGQSLLSHCQHHARIHGVRQPLLQDTQKTSKSSQPGAPESGILTWQSVVSQSYQPGKQSKPLQEKASRIN